MRPTTEQKAKLIGALSHDDADVRLKAAMTAGSNPDPEFIEVLIERCGIEDDFYVRDMLTWALIHHPVDDVIPRLRVDLASSYPQARGQALHTLSKIGAPQSWEWITTDHIHDEDDRVARPAWRAAVAVAPRDEYGWLADELVKELGRGDYDAMRGLARALVELDAKAAADADADAPSLIEGRLAEAAEKHPKPVGRAHAEATLRLRRDQTVPFSLTEPEG